MKVEKDKIVAIEYILKDTDGKILDSSTENGSFEYLHGHKNLIVGLEKELEGKEPGDKFSAVIEPAEGYGDYDPKLVSEVDRSQFDPDLEIKEGMAFQAESNAGPVIVHVTKVTDKTITVDANHELAGKTLCFDVEVKAVADATKEQIEAGSLYTGGCGGGCSCGSCGGDDDGSCGCGGGCSGCGGGCH
ncbi:MAG: peptidylprolyl isomerase [Treponema sp.]|nr:peptidylprolyl isomerase [Treponema sp.]